MSKKGFGKFLLGAAVLGTAAALIAYVKQTQSKEDLRDDFDDFDDELDEEIFDHETVSKKSDDRHYVTIPLDHSAEEEEKKTDSKNVTANSSSEQETPATSSVELDVEETEAKKDIHAFNLEDEA